MVAPAAIGRRSRKVHECAVYLDVDSGRGRFNSFNRQRPREMECGPVRRQDFKPASLAAMLTPGKLSDGENSGVAMAKMMAAAGAPADQRPQREYGYALFLSEEEGHRKIDHGGGIYGFSSSLSEFPDDKTTVVVLSNAIGKDVGASKVAGRIERLAIGLPAKK